MSDSFPTATSVTLLSAPAMTLRKLSASNTFKAYDDSTPVNWLYFAGGWGDQQYPDSDSRQDNFLDLGIEWKYVSGPTGPLFKQLTRSGDVCPDNGKGCIVWPKARAK